MSLIDLAKKKDENLLKEEEEMEKKVNLASKELIDFLNSDKEIVQKVKELDDTFRYLYTNKDSRISIYALKEELLERNLLFPFIYTWMCGGEYQGIGFVKNTHQKLKQGEDYTYPDILFTFSTYKSVLGYKKRFFKRVPITEEKEYLDYSIPGYITLTLTLIKEKEDAAKKAFKVLDDTINFIKEYLK